MKSSLYNDLVPAAPLLEALAKVPPDLWPMTPRSQYRIRLAGTVRMINADRYAVALGYHPSQLWPEWQ